MNVSNPKNKGGRPKKDEEISTDEIIEIMIEAAMRGGFFQQIPYEIYREKKIMVSLSYLEKIKDDTFLRAKSVAFAMCTKYWTELMCQAAIPAAVFIFIMKNVGKWTDNREIKIDAAVETSDKTSDAERKARIEKIKAMARDGR